jgi:gamma-glutamylcyclotransferase (GGCT)/AIG2-like uncharacterized protein YtfP
MEHRLFVYGTLMENFGSKMATILKANSNFLGVGQLPGKLFDLGRYPGAVYEEKSSFFVQGHILELLEPAYLLPILDEYEGIGTHFQQPNEYKRRIVPIAYQDQILSCYCYLYNLPTENLVWIASGNYLEHLTVHNSNHSSFTQTI